MATSLYGTVKKINQSCFVFDKIYNTRADMEANKDIDGVYHSRYVLVTYGERYSLVENTNPTTNENGDIPNYLAQQGYVYNANANLTETWVNHYNTDIRTYGNQYDNTVWQKIYEGASVKYIMVASLNARAPGLTINEDYYSFNLPEDETGEVYYTKVAGSTIVNTSIRKASYPIPKWHETISNDLIYHLDMPMPLKINLGKELNYFQEGLSPSIHSANSSSNNLSQSNNYIRWEHILKDSESNEVIGADFNFNVPAIGQIISDVYDAMYGIPDSGTTRPTNANNMVDVLEQTGNVGIIGVLSNLGLYDGQEQTYLLKCDWDAASGAFGSIIHKPDKITNISVANNGLWTITAIAQ